MRVAHLFAGAGGGLLADLIIGHTPVLAVEKEDYCCKILQERKEDGWYPELHIHCGDIREFDFKPYRGRVDCIAAGFPCQDISAAGRGAGLDGDRSGLVWEVFRAIDEIQPKIVFLENSPNIRTKGRDRITAALVERGYRWRDGKIAAFDVGAGHKRDRWFCLAANYDGMRKLEHERREQRIGGLDCNSTAEIAYTDSINGDMGGLCSGSIPQFKEAGVSRGEDLPHSNCIGWDWRSRSIEKESWRDESSDGNNQTADIMQHRLQGAIQQGGLSEADAETIKAVAGYTASHHWSPPDAGICGMVDGVANRTHRIKALGNGQVPLQAAAAFIILSGAVHV